MFIQRLKLRNFRNYSGLDVYFPPGFHFFTGDNAQGKSNLLEAIYLLSTLKSFRGAQNSQMVQQGFQAYFVGCTFINDRNNEIRNYWSSREHRITLNDKKITKAGDFFGILPSVLFCVEDIQLIKGAASLRRRYLDYLLAQSNPLYLPLLQRYGTALRSRNALFRQNSFHSALLESFTKELIKTGTEIIRFRSQLIKEISHLVTECYHNIAGENVLEQITIRYKPNVLENMELQLAHSYQKELNLQYTVVGPHRDDLEILINDTPLVKFGSEGQQRTCALALKMVQASYLTKEKGVPPLLLIDDVMGELDHKRRQSFLPLLDKVSTSRGQMFMTCTEKNWNTEPRHTSFWKIVNGTIHPS